MRVASLLPSATEIVCALGGLDTLVGVSHECDFPSEVRALPRLTSARLQPSTKSRDIDAAVRAVLRDALSIYAVDERRLAELAPDLIITQDLCEVCAVSLDDVRSAVARLRARPELAILSLSPTRLGHVFEDIESVARALGKDALGRRVRRELEARTASIAERTARAARRPRVVSIEWLEPLMLGGTWMPELIELAGGVAVGARAGEPAPTLGAAELAALEPDVVLVKPCGFSLERTLRERALVELTIGSAVPRARIYVSDGNAFFNRPGPRLVESLEILAACLNPDLFADFAEKHAASIFAVRASAG